MCNLNYYQDLRHDHQFRIILCSFLVNLSTHALKDKQFLQIKSYIFLKVFCHLIKWFIPVGECFRSLFSLLILFHEYEYAIICLFIFLPINLWPISSIELLLIKSLWHSYRNMFVGISFVSITTRGIYVWSSRCIFNFTRNFFQSDCTILYSHSKCCMHDNI